MKKIVICLFSSLMYISNSFAADKCFNTVSKQLQKDAKKSSDWGFEGLSILKKKNVKSVLEEALAEDEEEDRQQMLAMISDSNILFYVLAWNAPSNSGATAIAVNKKTCKQVVDVLLFSEE